LFAVASRRSVVVERARTGTTVATVTPPSPATGVALAPGDDALAVTGRDGRVRVYGLDGTLRRTLGGGPALTRPAFSPDGTTLAAGSTDHTVHLWNLSTGRDRVLRGHTDVVESARFSPDGSELVTASADHFARVWDVATGRTTLVLRGAFARVSDASFSPDGRWIVTAGPGKAGLFDARSGALLFYLQGHRGPLTSASFAADGQTIVTSGADGTVRTYRCDVCVGLPGLERLADERLAATHRRLSARERRDYLP
jgi:WD40 repeat protein